MNGIVEIDFGRAGGGYRQVDGLENRGDAQGELDRFRIGSEDDHVLVPLAPPVRAIARSINSGEL